MDLAPGEMVAGKYKVERRIGRGGMGEVYLAENIILARRVALKVMGAGASQSDEAMNRFLREAKSASQVAHPGIVQVFDAGWHRGAPWIAMELLDGETLRERLERERRLPASEAVRITRELLGALGAVHAVGIVHRDVKPENVFLHRTGGEVRPKLLDFGVAKQRLDARQLTATGAVYGTACYMAPEQATDSSRVDPRSDLYAVGCVLYECVSGETPFTGVNMHELIARVLTEPPRDLRSLAPDVPDWLAALVHRALSRDPDGRPSSAADMIALLDAGAAGHSVPMPPRTQATPAVSAPPGLPSSFPPTAHTPSPVLAAPGPFAHGGPGGASPGPFPHGTAPMGAYSPSSPVHVPPVAPPARRSSVGIVLAILAVVALLSVCVVGLVVGFGALVGAAGVFTGAGFGDHLQWNDSGRPLPADVNGDGTVDVVGWVTLFDPSDSAAHVAAFDGRTGEELWRTPRITDIAGQTTSRAAVARDRLIVADDAGEVHGYDLADGSPVFHFAFGERVDQICPGAPGAPEVVLVRTDGGGERVALADGTRSPGPQWIGCSVRARLDSYVPTGPFDRPFVIGDAAPVADPAAVVVAGVNVGRALVDQESSTRVVFGTRAPGTAVPVVEGTPPGRRPWLADVPAGNPLRAATGLPSSAAIGRGRVVVAYDAGDDCRLTAFELATGRRAWDVAIPDSDIDSPAATLLSGDLVLVSHWTYLDAFDVESGERRWRVGRWQ